MNKYEITIITKEDQKEEPVKKEIESIGGKILAVNSLGQKQLAFPIKKETAGYYTSVEFEVEPEKVMELNRKLSLKNEVLRHLIITAKEIKPEEVKAETVKAPKETPAEEKTEKPAEEPKAEPEETKAVAPEKTEEVTEVKPKPKKTAAKSAKKAEAEAKEEAASTKDRLKALDEKLDELLKE